MSPYRNYKSLFLYLVGALILLVSCEKKPNKPDLPEETLILNHWIWEGMHDIYLWEKYLPGLDPDTEPDSEAFFYKLLYPDDRDSWIVDDHESLADMFDGVELTTGLSARPGLISDTRVISIVEYVTPNSPATEADIKRGDIIIAIDGQSLTSDNYYKLYYQTTATLEFGEWNGTDLVSNGVKITLTAIQLNQNPIIHSEVISYEGIKTGYLVYTQFTTGRSDEWLDELNGVFEDFISEGISSVVIDLRYNRGGSLDLSAYIASTLGPASAMENSEVFVTLIWNDFYNDLWMEYDLDDDGKPDGKDSKQLVIRLPESQLNLNLTKVYFLTTGSTASASESLMTGLYPYTDVVQIGTATYGKCYGSITIDDWVDPKRHSWAMQPIVLKYSNADGYTDFVTGINPDFFVEDDLHNAAPFGSLDDPLLAKAMEEITGVAPARKKSVESESDFTALPVPRKPMLERIIEWPEKPGSRELF